MFVGTVAGGAVYLMQERSAGAVIDDFTMWAGIKNGLLQYGGADFVDVSVDVIDSRVMLAGMVKNPKLRLAASKVAWEQEGVREVINEIQLYSGSSFSKIYAQDLAINSQVKAKLLMTKHIRSMNYVSETVGGVVYLFGTAQDKEELEIAADAAGRVKGVRRVVAHVKLRRNTKNTLSVTKDGVSINDGLVVEQVDADDLWA